MVQIKDKTFSKIIVREKVLNFSLNHIQLKKLRTMIKELTK